MSTTTESRTREMKHLGFVRIAAIQTVVLASRLYDYVKRNAGPLRSVVGSVEGATKSALGPVCDKFKSLPDQLLFIADQKVDEAMQQFDKHAPSLAKKVVHHVHDFLDAAGEKGRKLLSEVETGGPVAGFQYAVSELKQTCISLIAITYVAADGFKPFHTVADMVAPAAAHWSEKYNKLVVSMSRKGHKIFSYFPQIPTDEISQACRKQKASNMAQNNGSTEHKEKPSSSSSDSD
uniref:REF/SRPP-like protein n=1 Tax=Kalanchoe fedtschenkoi TaxID=63787 RepID=A0A7N0VJF5_KALFE